MKANKPTHLRVRCRDATTVAALHISSGVRVSYFLQDSCRLGKMEL